MPQQAVRLAAVFVLVAAAFVVARSLLVPETFGDEGPYRAAAVDTILAREIQYAGHQTCSTCHRGIAERRMASNHRGVVCETCHGPAASHASAPLDEKPPAPRERGYCPLCHGYDPSRPTGFPQINPVSHNPLVPCMTCHDPHAPEPPTVPEECGACHGQIARQKSVSHHATLPCQTCHAADDQHKVDPRSVRPDKPADRSFCGTCHATDAPTPATIPRVDLRTHGEDYLCWHCHYPHYPELES